MAEIPSKWRNGHAQTLTFTPLLRCYALHWTYSRALMSAMESCGRARTLYAGANHLLSSPSSVVLSPISTRPPALAISSMITTQSPSCDSILT